MSARDQALDVLLLCFEPELIEPRRLGKQRGAIGEIGERRAAPERQRVVEGRDRDARVDGHGLPRIANEGVEPRRVELDQVEEQHVAGWPPLESIVAQCLADVRHERLQGVASLLGGRLDELVDLHLGRHDRVGTDEQARQDGALLRPSEGDRAIPRVDLERSQDAELHPPTVATVAIHAQRHRRG